MTCMNCGSTAVQPDGWCGACGRPASPYPPDAPQHGAWPPVGPAPQPPAWPLSEAPPPPSRWATPEPASWSSPNASWQPSEPSVEHARFLPDPAIEPSWAVEDTLPAAALSSWSNPEPQARPISAPPASWSSSEPAARWSPSEPQATWTTTAEPQATWTTSAEPRATWTTTAEPQATWTTSAEPRATWPTIEPQATWATTEPQQASWATDATTTFGLPGQPTAGAPPASYLSDESGHPTADATVVDGFPAIPPPYDNALPAHAAYGSPPPYMVSAQAPYARAPKAGNTLSRVAFGLAVLALLPFSVLCGTAAIICAVIGLRRGERRAKPALIVAIIATVIGIALGVVAVALSSL